MLGKGHQRAREFVIHEAGNGQSIIRGDFKLVRTKNGLELYNLKTDHAEKANLAEKLPGLVKELHALMLGERVNEPKGFANTYHHWTGADASLASDADNWSDYIYANAGIAYTTDAGAPQVAWTARMENTGAADNTAIADRNLEFLALEIRGGAATQRLILDTETSLTGRNEIRIAERGSLAVNGGTVASLRWIEIERGGELQGTGTLDAEVYNNGKVAVTNELRIAEDYFQDSEGTLHVSWVNKGTPVLKVRGDVTLAGELTLEVPANFKGKTGSEVVVLEAGSISGRFSNAAQEVDVGNGTKFKIEYRNTAVVLSAL